ncbi:MAG: uL15 family ribosomal protein [Candidatus Sungbacteria bacterium]|nr:uL15 family ribosomal protein [Candidatus Sungbacteria bacterium]
MQLHTLKSNTKMRRGQRIGRGGKRGTTSGRGTKGQKSRAGHKIRPQIREIIKRIPKLRGYKFRSFRKQAVSVSLATLEKNFSKGDRISARALMERGIVKNAGGIKPRIKILGSGPVSKSFSIVGLEMSRGARAAIEKAGGSIK